jgi:hypothetical protein
LNPDSNADCAAPRRDQRRRVRAFVALHLAAVGLIYAIALIVGGGMSGPPMPPLTVATATVRHAEPRPGPVVVTVEATPPVAAPLPAWTQRAEVSAPWEPH